MDTKWKKTRKLKNLLITLVILVPAIVLIALYPQMENAMLDKKNQWLIDWETRKEIYEKKGHLPKVVEIGCSLEEDLKRRDFTVNY